MEGRRSRIAVALALVALVAPSAFSAPTTRSTCSPVCRSSQDSRITYQEGKSYVYGFETEVITQVVGSSDEQSKIKVKGQAVIGAQSKCDFVLTLKDVAIQNPSGQSVGRLDEIEGSSLRFSYQDGQIESICVSEDDSVWSANIKRAVISMLTNAPQESLTGNEVYENDISGHCPTRYSISGDKIVKTRNLNTCTHRDGGASVLLGVPYTAKSKFNSMSLIDSTLTCTQTLKDNVFQHIDCQETHKVPLLSSQDSGVQTNIKSTLDLVSVQNSVARSSKAATKPSSIFYDHSDIMEVQLQKSSGSRAVDVLNKLCREVEDGTVSSKVPSLYLQLSKDLKTARKSDIKQMYENVKSGSICPKGGEKLKKLLLDAAASSGGDGSIAFIASLISEDSEEVNCHTKTLFKHNAPFAPHPDTGALEALALLVKDKEICQEYLLTASGVGHQYCKMVNPDCGSNSAYSDLVAQIAKHLEASDDEKGMRRKVAALQALGNLDHLTASAVSKISTILDSKKGSERLRVRALDAFRRDPCQNGLKKKAIRIFGDKEESTHVRIQAWLTVSKCVEQEDVSTLQTILDAEESSQVGSFVASHIKNLGNSASPSKAPIANALHQLTVPESMAKDARKFSRYSEYSSFFPALNLGGSAEGNLIFSQDSFIPRMTSANLTMDAFGRSYNFLEVGLYAEDFEHLLEKYFGPVGKVRQADVKGFVAKGAQKLSNLVESVRSRFRRDVKVTVDDGDVNALEASVDIHERTGDHGVGDVYIRIMGTSLLVESFEEGALSQEGTLAQKLKTGVNRMLEGAKDHKFDLTHPVTFLDQELVLPTFSGFPLNIEVEGSSVLSLQLKGNLELSKFFSQSDSDMRAKVVPSSAALLRSRMTVGTGPVESGLQLEGKVHSSAGVDVKLVKNAMQKLELRVNLPQEKMQVIDLRSDLYWVEQEGEVEKKTGVKNKLSTKALVDNECMNTFSKILGLKVCADMKIPTISLKAPFAVLNGPAVMSVSVEKSEPSMEGYYFKAEKTKTGEDSVGIDFHFDTPGSRTIRKVSASVKALQYKSSTPEYVFKLDSPITKLDVNYKRSFTDELKGVEIKVVQDGDAYNGKIQLKRISAGSVSKYEPVIQYTIAGGRPVKLIEGTVIRTESQGKVEIDLRSAGPLRSFRGSVKGSIEMPKKSDGFELKVRNLELASDLLGKLALDGEVEREAGEFEAKVHAKYGQQKQHSFQFETKVEKSKPGHYELKTKTRSSACTFLNFEVLAKASREGNKYQSELKYERGVEDPKVIVSHKMETRLESRKDFEVLHEFVVKHPAIGLDLYSKLDSKSAPGAERHADISFNFNTFKSEVKYKSDGQNLLDYDLKAKADYSGKTYEFSEVSKKVEANKQNFKTRFSVTPGFWYNADTDVTTKFEKSDIESLLSTTITSNHFAEPVIFKSGVRGKADGYNALLKLDMKGKNYVDIATSYKHAKSPKPATVNVKAFVLNYLDSKLSQTFSRGQSDTHVDVKWVPTGRKIEVRSKFAVEGETFNLNADLKWDAEKDASKAASFKSVTVLSFSKLQMDSKNDITVQGKSAKVNLRGQRMKEAFNGESNFGLDYTSPNGKQYNFLTVVNMENKVRVKAGKVSVKVTLPGEKPYSFTLDNRVSNIDPHEGTFDAVTELSMDYKGEKDVKFRGEVASSLPGNYRNYVGKVDLTGSVIPNPVSLNLKADVKKGKWSVNGDAKRGAKNGDFEVTVEYDIWSPKRTLDVKYNVNTPFQRVRALDGKHKVALLYDSLKHFEYTEDGSITINHGSPSQWQFLTSYLNNNFKYLSSYSQDGKSVFSASADGKVSKNKLVTDISATYEQETSSLSLELEHDLPSFKVALKGDSPITTFELKTSHSQPSNGVYETEVLAKLEGEIAFRVQNKLEMTPDKKSIDVLASVANEPARRLFLSVDYGTPQKVSVDSLLRWADNKGYVSLKGDFLHSREGYEANLAVDTPTFKSEKLKATLTRKSDGGKHNLSFKLKEGSAEKLSAVADYGKTLARSGDQKVYEGSLTIKGDKSFPMANFDGKFRLEDTVLSRARDNEDGKEMRASIELGQGGKTPIKGTLVLKTSDQEKRAQASFCNESKGRCRRGEAVFRHQHESNGNMEYSLKVLGETEVSGEKSTAGVHVRTVKTAGAEEFDHTVKLILNKNSETVGYRLYHKDEEYGAEVLLPERTMATVLKGKRTGPTDGNVDLSFYIDRVRKPNRKISFILITEAMKNAVFGRETEFIFRHPDLGKDLKVSGKFAITDNGERKLEIKTVFDLFKEGNEIVVLYKAHRENPAVGKAFKTHWSVTSKGQSINFGGNSEINIANGVVNYKQEVHYETKERQMKKATIEALLSFSKMSVLVNGPSGKFLELSGEFEEFQQGYKLMEKIYLPGMEDTRIMETQLVTVSPRKLQWKAYTSNSPSGVFYEAILGFKTRDQFVLGLYDHEASGEKTLAGVSVTLSKNRILNVQSSWEKENFKNVWSKMQSRGDRQAQKLRQLSSSFMESFFDELGFVATNLRKSIPNLRPAITSAQTELKAISTELNAHEDTKLLVKQAQSAQGFVKKAVQFAYAMAKAARRVVLTFVHSINEQWEVLRDVMGDYTGKVPYNMDDMKACFNDFLNSLNEAGEKGMKLLKDFITRAVDSMPEIINKINLGLDMTAEISESIQACVKSALEQMTAWWKSAEFFIRENVLENVYVQMFVEDFTNLVQALVTEFIDESKVHALKVKDYVLKFVPEKDLQEIVEMVIDYVSKKSRNQPVDDAVVIKGIYEKIVALVKKVGSQFLSVDSSEGMFSASIPLPTPISSLSDIARIFDKLSFPSPPTIHYNLPSYRFGFAEIFNKIRHGARMDELVPPYDGYGLVIGSQYYKTFDGKIFRFEGSCQYLLASDFEDGNFTVVVDYDRKPSGVERAFIVKDDDDTIAIKSDKTVVINGKSFTASELSEPKEYNQFKVESRYDMIIVSGKKGVKAACSLSYDVCGVKVDGYYHGKVLGMLGKFNQEAFDDMTKNDGKKIAANVNEFAESWKLDKQCRERPVMTLPVITAEASQKCAEALESKASSMRPCYGVVSPTDYQRMCENLSSAPNYDVKKAVCTASDGYAKACKMSYAPVMLPEDCRKV